MRRLQRRRASPLLFFAILLGLSGIGGCVSSPATGPSLSFTPIEFREILRERVPGLSAELVRAPFVISKTTIALAKRRVMAAPPGESRVQALVSFLSDPKPEGLGLRYDWESSANAQRTIEQGKGDCVALATVLVGLGRGLGWPIYFAEARTHDPETHEFDQLTVLSDHMVVIVLAKTVRMVVDFLGLVGEGYDVRPIDDLTAYAHLINNVSGHRLVNDKVVHRKEDWRVAGQGFALATQIQPTLGRAWNNLGIAYSRLGRFDDARSAYHRAVELDTAFGSPERNLIIMETRATAEPTLFPSELPRED